MCGPTLTPIHFNTSIHFFLTKLDFMKNAYTSFLTACLLLLSGALVAQNNITFQVNMQNETVAAEGVSVAWAPPGIMGLADVSISPLSDADGDGIYTGTFDVTEDTIGYFFINGAISNPLAFETVPEDCGLTFSFMGISAAIRPYIPDGDATLDVVCFGECTDCLVTDCDSPAVLVDDDASSYDLGDVGEQAHWGLWPGASLGIQVDTFEGDNVFSIIGDPDNQDAVFLTGDRTSGHYRIAFSMYIPEGNNAYFNVQHQIPDAMGYWAFDVFFDGGGEGVLELNDDPGGTDTEYAFAYPEDEWFGVILYVDLDNDLARLNVDELTVSVWTFSDGVTNGGAEFDLLQLSGINFYPIEENHIWYLDGLEFWEIPAAGDGQYCYTAQDIDVGVHTIAELDCYGGGLDLGGGDGAEKAAWFRYMPAEDGIISISSCDQGVDTRGWILQGTDCGDLSIVGVNDDMCDTGLDDDYASYREAIVTGGETYYIVWDNAWESAGFDFELTFTTDEPVAGDFCQTAIAIDPGEYPLDEFTGNAGVGGFLIGTSGSSSVTPYINSEWYAFTPTEEGSMTISSCDGAASDTYVFVYTGDCTNFDGLTLVARSDDDCGGSAGPSLIEDYEVTVGETYLIEWVDRWSEDSFLWELIFTPVVDVDEATLAEGLSIFPNPARDLLQVNIDLPEAADQLSLRLYNSLGAQLLQRNLGSVTTVREELNLENVPAGIYWLELTNGEQQVTRKVVVQ